MKLSKLLEALDNNDTKYSVTLLGGQLMEEYHETPELVFDDDVVSISVDDEDDDRIKVLVVPGHKGTDDMTFRDVLLRMAMGTDCETKVERTCHKCPAEYVSFFKSQGMDTESKEPYVITEQGNNFVGVWLYGHYEDVWLDCIVDGVGISEHGNIVCYMKREE